MKYIKRNGYLISYDNNKVIIHFGDVEIKVGHLPTRHENERRALEILNVLKNKEGKDNESK